MNEEELKYQIALTLIPGIGSIAAKKLVAYCGGAKAVFEQTKAHLLKIPSIGEKAASAIHSSFVFQEAEKEIRFIQDNSIEAHYYLNNSYPQRLLHCDDGPIILYTKGKVNLNPEKAISIVGTRKATVKGKEFCNKLVEELAAHSPTIISGLAYGIDITAHKAALKNNLATIGILACGLDDIYPKTHFSIAKKMQYNGGLASDYKTETKLFPTQFAERNRIVAGMCDAVIVIESSEKGGSLITADLANGYNRDVFAVPGRPNDSQSIGCNRLIKQNKAALIESAKDIEYIMGWEEKKEVNPNQQTQLFINLSEDEQLILNQLKSGEGRSIDEISLFTKFTMSKTATLLLELEFKNIVRSLPGKVFELT